MAQISLETRQKAVQAQVKSKSARLYFVDYLRAALIILVVLHHVAVVHLSP